MAQLELPPPPYYAVIFTSTRTGADAAGYEAADAEMSALVATMPGYLGVEYAGDASFGITISYWADEASITAWREHPKHRAIQKRGHEVWYSEYTTRVAKVERLGGIKRR